MIVFVNQAMDAQKLIAALKEDEGFQGRPYLDTTGHVKRIEDKLDRVIERER